jgi:UDP-glucose 4-epimerase
MKKTKITSVLVTGGAGFIGSHVVDELVMDGFKVVVLDDLSGGFRKNVNPKAVFVKGSVTDIKLVDSLFSKYHFAYVFHAAAYAAEGLSHFIRRFNYTNNLIGSINLINASVRYKVRCFVFTSSIAVYGAAQYPMTESTLPEPEDPYGIAKYAVELDLKAAHKMFGLDYIIFRPHNVYGERQNIGDKYRNVLGIFMNKVMLGEPMPIFGDGEQQRAFTHISDVAPVIACSIGVKKAYNKTFNVGADTPYTVNELADTVAIAMGQKRARKTYFSPRNEVKVAYSDHALSRKVFGTDKKPLPLPKGVKLMAAWVKKEGAKRSKRFKDIEITENLPPAWLQ